MTKRDSSVLADVDGIGSRGGKRPHVGTSAPLYLHTIRSWIVANKITKINSDQSPAWARFESMYASFVKEGCSRGTPLEKAMPKFEEAYESRWVNASDAYKATTRIYIATKDGYEYMAGFASVTYLERRGVETFETLGYPKKFLYIAHVAAERGCGQAIHSRLLEIYADVPFLLELERNSFALASKAYIRWGFSPCKALATECLWAKFLESIMGVEDAGNPTFCKDEQQPWIYGDIRRWMIELPAHSNDGAFDLKRIEAAMNGFKVVDSEVEDSVVDPNRIEDALVGTVYSVVCPNRGSIGLYAAHVRSIVDQLLGIWRRVHWPPPSAYTP